MSTSITESTDDRVLVNQNDAELEGSDTSSDDVGISSPFETSQIRIEPKPTQMDALIKRLRHQEIDISPDFQRSAGIWTDKVQSRLIESLLLRIPIPAFYFDATDDNKWIVVDGLQRLTTIKRFVVDQSLSLTGLQFLGADYKDRHFRDLPRSIQRRIEEADIVLYLIKPGTPPDVKFTVFQRINTGGLPLSAQEIRHALNQGPITTTLKGLAESKEFVTATAGGVSPNRMADRECVLRFIAFTLIDPVEYKTDDFDLFLNKAMASANKMSPPQLTTLSNQFLKAMNAAYNIFGNDAFRKRYKTTDGRYPVNKALFESWSVNLGKLNDLDIEHLIVHSELIKNKFIELMGDRTFDNAISQGTGSISRVTDRFSKIKKIIEEVIDVAKNDLNSF
ncbi:MAG: DUF262 domain-containing protein [Solidesulfovibrio sp.]